MIFQLESGYGLLRILAIEEIGGERVWHLAVYNELFPNVESADEIISNHPEQLTLNLPHVALTNRAFYATQTAVMANLPIGENELKLLKEWHLDPNKEIYDRSIRLMIGIR